MSSVDERDEHAGVRGDASMSTPEASRHSSVDDVPQGVEVPNVGLGGYDPATQRFHQVHRLGKVVSRRRRIGNRLTWCETSAAIMSAPSSASTTA